MGAAYEEVLKEAQELGFAEADPTADVEGLDAARKMTILATLGLLNENRFSGCLRQRNHVHHGRRYSVWKTAWLHDEADWNCSTR